MQKIVFKSNKVLALLFLITIVFSSSITYVLAVGTNTFTISSGLYPGAPTYTIYKSGTTYFAKTAWGTLAYSGTNASYLIQTVVNSIPTTATAKIFFNYGYYPIDAEIDLSNHYSLSLEFESMGWRQQTPYGFYATRDIRSVFNIDNSAHSSYAMGTLKNLHIVGGRTAGWGTDGIRIYAAFMVKLEDVQIDNCDIGINAASGGDNHYYLRPRVTGCNTGLYISGAGIYVEKPYVAEIQTNGIYLAGALDKVIEPQVYFYDLAKEGYRGIYLYNAEGCEVKGGEVYNNDDNSTQGTGIELWRASTSNVVQGVLLHNNLAGIVLHAPAAIACTYNMIYDNRIIGGSYGIFEQVSGGTVDYNLISNNFVNGTTLGIHTEGANSKVVASWNSSAWVSEYPP